jgi:predicted secreted Zn-dependent protease
MAMMTEEEKLEIAMENARKVIEEMKKENIKLQDEVDSLWAMMDEITKSDIEKHSHLLKDLESDALIRSLMITKKKVDC